MHYSIRQIADGEVGTDQTLKAIGELVSKAIKRPYLRLKCLEILRSQGVPDRNPQKAAEAIFNWVRHHVRYVNDPVGVETIQDPEITIDLGAGDCDDHSALVGSLAMSIGIPARFAVVGLTKDHLQHIYPELLINGRWTPADTTETNQLGKPPASMPTKKFYSLTGEPAMNGLGLGQGRGVVVSQETLTPAIYRTVLKILKENWQAGRINRTDVKSYLRVIDEGNSPAHGTFANPVMREAIQAFLNYVNTNQLQSFKPEGALSGLNGLDGFLSSIWNGVKKVVGGVVKIATGGGSQQPVQVNLPDVRVTTTAPPASVASGVSEFLTSPVALIAIGALVFVLARK